MENFVKNNISELIIKDRLISSGMKEYLEWVSKQLDCDVSDLIYLDIHPDYKEDDEEGLEIDSFFKKGTKINKTLIHSDMSETKIDELCNLDIYIGDVYRVEVFDKVFYADQNASPYGVITKKIK